jgi:flagellar hook-basal body complex protein FliE
MNIGSIPKLSLDGVNNPFQTSMSNLMPKVSPELDATEKPDFKSALANLADKLNTAVTVPDGMMHDAMTTGSVDVHDLMVANAKAELLVSVTTQVATKVVQAYDKILQIQL